MPIKKPIVLYGGKLKERQPGDTISGIGGTSVVDAGLTLVLNYGNDYFFSGTIATWTLPAISLSIVGRANSITIKNRGTGELTIETNGLLNVIFLDSLTNNIILETGDRKSVV